MFAVFLVWLTITPFSSQENNAVLKEIGEMRREEGLTPHMELIQMCGIVNLEDAQKIAGSRAYYLINEGPLLNQAPVNYGIQFAMKRGFTPIQTPYFMVKDVMGECSQLSQFDEELYKVTGEGDDKYLIAPQSRRCAHSTARSGLTRRICRSNTWGIQRAFGKKLVLAVTHLGSSGMGVGIVLLIIRLQQGSAQRPCPKPLSSQYVHKPEIHLRNGPRNVCLKQRNRGMCGIHDGC